jgi:hypothetical protein
VQKKKAALLVITTIVGNCLGNLSSDVLRSGYKSLARNIQQIKVVKRVFGIGQKEPCAQALPMQRT